MFDMDRESRWYLIPYLNITTKLMSGSPIPRRLLVVTLN